MNIQPCPYVSDMNYKKLTWKERIKSLKPWVKYKLVEDPTIFIIDDTIICSHKTAKKIEQGLIDLTKAKKYENPFSPHVKLVDLIK